MTYSTLYDAASALVQTAENSDVVVLSTNAQDWEATDFLNSIDRGEDEQAGVSYTVYSGAVYSLTADGYHDERVLWISITE